MKRALVVVLALAACGTPEQYGRLNSWIATHVTIEHVDVPGRDCGRTLNEGHLIQLDPACGDVPWYYWHEIGHAVDFQVFGHLRGDTSIGNEQTANCFAEIATGHSALYSAADIARGYWDCPDDEVARTRAAMVAAGIW